MSSITEVQNVEVIARDLDLTDPTLNWYGFTNGKRTVIFRTRTQQLAKGYLLLRVRQDAEGYTELMGGQPLSLEGYED
jgi:hypothetical protein